MHVTVSSSVKLTASIPGVSSDIRICRCLGYLHAEADLNRVVWSRGYGQGVLHFRDIQWPACRAIPASAELFLK